MRLFALNSLVVSLLLLAQPSQAQSEKPSYGIRDADPPTGSAIRREVVKGSVLPINKRYDELTAEEKSTLNQYYERVDPGDEPLSDAKLVLGEQFDPDDESQRSDLEQSIQPAVLALGGISKLASTARLGALSKLSPEQTNEAAARIRAIHLEADELVTLASDPSKAGRLRLYARVAAWIKEHPTASTSDDVCVVCGKELLDATDPVTGALVKVHLEDAAQSNSDLLSQTLSTWASNVLATLSLNLPETLSQENRTDLPENPGKLIYSALVDELFENEPFAGTLGLLKADFRRKCKAAIEAFPAFEVEPLAPLGGGKKEFQHLEMALKRLNNAIAFSSWRSANQVPLGSFMLSVVGKSSTPEQVTVADSLLGRLVLLRAMVEGIEPISHAMKLCQRMIDDIAKRRAKEKRLATYAVASQALTECIAVGTLAEQQVQTLQKQLHKKAVSWRSRIYSGAFPSTSLHLIATKMSGDGELQFMVGSNGVAAPAQHVANASALRASLVGFFLAYWEHMLTERGGLRLLLLDDPQELLDADNRERLADSVKQLIEADAQPILTTHDARFASLVAKRAQGLGLEISHQYLHPATPYRGTIYPTPSVAKVQKDHDAYVSDPDDPVKAQEYASECRIFIEGRIGDIFDNTAFPTAATLNLSPTLSDHLGRLRGLISSSSIELFRSSTLASFCNDSGLRANAPALTLLNKAHHSSKATIRPAEVSAVEKDLERLRRSAERAHEEFRLLSRREPLIFRADVAPLETKAVPSFKVLIQPSLAAFVRGASFGESQETEFEEIGSDWFDGKAFFLLRASTMGFAGPALSVAIVESEPSQVEDRRLVVARQGKEIFARRPAAA